MMLRVAARRVGPLAHATRVATALALAVGVTLALGTVQGTFGPVRLPFGAARGAASLLVGMRTGCRPLADGTCLGCLDGIAAVGRVRRRAGHRQAGGRVDRNGLAALLATAAATATPRAFRVLPVGRVAGLLPPFGVRTGVAAGGWR